jgi:menaquinone-dependent protoporphyrinogen oxidase
MSQVLVAYASKHGATAEIAEAIAEQLRQAGHAVDCVPAGEAARVDSYDAVVIGSAVYMKRWRPEARRLLKRHRKTLANSPFLGVRGHIIFGGRLPLEPSNFMERAMVENCPPEKRDLRDWDAIRAWALEIGASLSSVAA